MELAIDTSQTTLLGQIVWVFIATLWTVIVSCIFGCFALGLYTYVAAIISYLRSKLKCVNSKSGKKPSRSTY